MSSRRRPGRKAAAGALVAASLLLGLAVAGPAAAHGSMEGPVSRSKNCYDEGPESPRSAACADAIAIGGTQPFYDWHEVNIPDAAGRHRELIPDGELCSAGREKYAGLDQARADWTATPMRAGAHTFRYAATAPHAGSFEVYLTREGYDPAAPLAWSDLEPLGTVDDPPLSGGAYVFEFEVPERSGRHLVYAVWQRSDSPEAFYSCSDVVFDGAAAAPPAEAAEPAEPTEPAEPAEPAADERVAPAPAGDQGPPVTADEGTPLPPRSGEDAEGAVILAPEDVILAESGGGGGAGMLALAGATAVAIGAAALLTAGRRRARGRQRP